MQQDGTRPFIVNEADTEKLGELNDTMRMWLYADHNHTGKKVSFARGSLTPGADGATPHYHKLSAEFFYVLDGRLQVLVGDDEVAIVEKNGLAFIPPMTTHAFAAPFGYGAEFNIFFIPGHDRFQFFRNIFRVMHGTLSIGEHVSLAADNFDQYARDSDHPSWATWRKARDTRH